MHPRHIPFFRLFLPWALGIALSIWADRPVPGLEYGLAAGAVLLFLLVRRQFHYRYRWVFGSLLLVTVLMAGYYHGLANDERRASSHFNRIPGLPTVFYGMVYELPVKGRKIKIPLRLEAAGPSASELRPCTGHVLLFLDPTPEAGRLRYGDKIWVQAAIRPVSGPMNPHAFDYRQYLHFRNIHYQAFVQEQSYGVIATGYGHCLWQMAFRWRERLLEVLRIHFPGQDEFAVAAALLVGYKDELSDELRRAYAETGSMHALAVSGTHVGLLYAGLLFLLQRLPWSGNTRRWGQTGLSLAAIWAFALVTGAAPSVLRAALMFTAYLVSKAIRRQSSIWNILGGTAFVLLLADPYLLCNAGFQLSFTAVAGIVFFYPLLQKITLPLPKWAGPGWEVLLIGVAAQLGTLPLSLFYFHQFPVYFWLSGWVVVLGGAVFLWGGSILVILSALAPQAAAWLGWGLHQWLRGMNGAIACVQQLPGSVIGGIWVDAATASLLGVFCWVLAWAVTYRKPRWLLFALALLATLGTGYFLQKHRQLRQQQITLYHVNRHLLFDFLQADKRITCADTIPPRQEQFAAESNRWAHGIRQACSLAVGQPYSGRHLWIRPPFIQFFQVSLVLVDAPGLVSDVKRDPTPVDVLILHGNPRVTLSECIRQFPCRQIVFTAANSRRRVLKWKEGCQKQRIPYWDIGENGAWEQGLAVFEPIPPS
ncbi:MAG: ComEC family competence protein [Bacteroidetes bacterium]|nr:MAG: ComEC family competence protein [Bacteroidota bacterium]